MTILHSRIPQGRRLLNTKVRRTLITLRQTQEPVPLKLRTIGGNSIAVTFVPGSVSVTNFVHSRLELKVDDSGGKTVLFRPRFMRLPHKISFAGVPCYQSPAMPVLAGGMLQFVWFHHNRGMAIDEVQVTDVVVLPVVP